MIRGIGFATGVQPTRGELNTRILTEEGLRIQTKTMRLKGNPQRTGSPTVINLLPLMKGSKEEKTGGCLAARNGRQRTAILKAEATVARVRDENERQHW